MVFKKGNKINIGKTHSDDAKRKMSEANKGEWISFEEARVFVRSLKLRSQKEWQQYCKFGKDGIPRPNDIPSLPSEVYKNDGWKDWGDWLGTGFIATQNRERKPFDEAREFTRSLNLKSSREWIEYCKFGKDGIPRPDNIPSNPEKAYKNDGWNGYPNWLGYEDLV